MDTSKIFEALPHVNEIWVTSDGHFHLHPNKGGRQIFRNPVEEQVTGIAQEKVVKSATKK